MKNIKDFNLSELESLMKEWNQPAFHARQIFSWIYKKHAVNFEVMSNLPLQLRNKLKESFCIIEMELAGILESKDRTKKFLFNLNKHNYIEAAWIPADRRVTCCISTQLGCKFSCAFCASGMKGFKGNLSVGQILDEAVYLNNSDTDNTLTHMVFMGTGEPFDNYDNVIKAIRIINADYSFNIGARRITISTSGIIPAIDRLSEEGLQLELSVSLHAADNRTRNALMPVNRKYPLKELLSACFRYIEKTNRQVTFEYILIEGINSGFSHAQELVKILKNMNCKVNLIPYNCIGQSKFMPPAKQRIADFQEYLLKHDIVVTLRKSRGQDIDAACGQLRMQYENK